MATNPTSDTQSCGAPHLVEPPSAQAFSEAVLEMQAAINATYKAVDKLRNPQFPTLERLAFDAVSTYRLWAENERAAAVAYKERAEAAEAALEQARRDAERWQAVRSGATNNYPYPFVAVRDPSNIVFQLTQAAADWHADQLIAAQADAVRSAVADAARNVAAPSGRGGDE